jgi:hypothetical protein
MRSQRLLAVALIGLTLALGTLAASAQTETTSGPTGTTTGSTEPTTGPTETTTGPTETTTGPTETTVVPQIIVDPTDGTPGASFRLVSSGFPTDGPSVWEVRWNDERLGSVILNEDGTFVWQGTVPDYAMEGSSEIQVCPVRVQIDVARLREEEPPKCLKEPFEVRYPDVSADPSQLQPGQRFEVNGEEWCCRGEYGEVLDTQTGKPWGQVYVDDKRHLRGEAVVPEDADTGKPSLHVCVPTGPESEAELCRPLRISVMAPTTTTVPEGVCGGSLQVDPVLGEPGSDMTVTMTVTAGLPEGCLANLELDGRQIGILDLNADERSTRTTVPEDMAPGSAELVAFDASDGRILDSTFFVVTGLPLEESFPWIWIAAAAGLLLLLGLGMALWQRATRGRGLKPEPDAPDLTPLLPMVPARWLEARLYARSSPETPVAYFRAGAHHRIEVTVGAPELPEKEVTPQSLRVVLTEPRLLKAPQSAEVMIHDNGPSTPASLTLDVPEDAGSVDARLLLVNGDRVVQTARLPQMVGRPPAGQPSNVAKVETVVRAVTLPPRNGVSASLVVDEGRFPTITRITASLEPRLIRLPDMGAEAVERIRHRLGEIVEAPEEYAGLEQEATRKLLVYLANHGRLLRSALMTFLGEELAASTSLQVISVAQDTYLPLELAYDHPAPRAEAAVCPRAGDTLRSLDVLAPCPGPHDDTVVCPVGFWGMSKVIERAAFQPRDDLPDGFLVAAQPISGRERIKLDTGVLIGPSNRVNAYDPSTISHLHDLLQDTAAKTALVDSWADWDREVAAQSPAILLLLPHTVYSDEWSLAGLEIGASDPRWVSAIGDSHMVPSNSPAIVLLLGCETAVAGAVSYEQFPGNLSRAGASIVVATLTDVLGRHAAPLAGRLVTLMLANSRGPVRMGEIMVRLRRQLLTEGFPVVLTLAVFGDSDWLLGES